jgi:rSAM/selenodomain-associated transferase 2
MSSAEERQTIAVSVIIPTLNEGDNIGPTLASATKSGVGIEVLVVDGGSTDHTTEVARGYGARVIICERGRGAQMHRGACEAKGAILWFVHADTTVPAGAADSIKVALQDERVMAGNFEVRFGGERGAARFMTWLYPQLRRLGLCYGDSAIFVRRNAYFKAGGFKSFPIFEDLDLLSELRKMGNFVHLSSTVITSSRRFVGRSFAITFTRWAALQCLYWLGVSPTRLGRLYGKHGARGEDDRKARGISSA